MYNLSIWGGQVAYFLQLVELAQARGWVEMHPEIAIDLKSMWMSITDTARAEGMLDSLGAIIDEVVQSSSSSALRKNWRNFVNGYTEVH